MIDEMRVSYGFPLRVAVLTDVGRIRANNEDSHGHAWLPDSSLFVIVADGMGGHEAGEVASGLAVQVLEEVVARDASADPRERLYHGLLEANEAILQEGRASGTRGMGTTAVAAVCRGWEVYVALVGDSRLYHIRRGHLVWRTVDHTRVQMLIEQGTVPEAAARAHPESGMLTRALGHARMADGRPLVPDVLAEPIRIERDDALVLCSDGLHDLLDDWEIAQVVAGREPADAAGELIRLAVERGGHDNVTVAVIVAGECTSDFDPVYVPDTPSYARSPEPAYPHPAAPADPAPPLVDPASALEELAATPPPPPPSAAPPVQPPAAPTSGGVEPAQPVPSDPVASPAAGSASGARVSPPAAWQTGAPGDAVPPPPPSGDEPEVEPPADAGGVTDPPPAPFDPPAVGASPPMGPPTGPPPLPAGAPAPSGFQRPEGDDPSLPPPTEPTGGSEAPVLAPSPPPDETGASGSPPAPAPVEAAAFGSGAGVATEPASWTQPGAPPSADALAPPINAPPPPVDAPPPSPGDAPPPSPGDAPPPSPGDAAPPGDAPPLLPGDAPPLLGDAAARAGQAQDVRAPLPPPPPPLPPGAVEAPAEGAPVTAALGIAAAATHAESAARPPTPPVVPPAPLATPTPEVIPPPAPLPDRAVAGPPAPPPPRALPASTTAPVRGTAMILGLVLVLALAAIALAALFAMIAGGTLIWST